MNAVGWVADTPIPRERLDARVRELRAGRLAGRLPAVGSKEDRQFLRWTAQVLLTEELCRIELARLTAGRPENDESVAESVAGSVAGSVAESIAEPVVAPVAEPTGIAGPIGKPVAEPTAEPIAEPVAAPVAEPTAAALAEPAGKPIAGPVAAPLAEPTAEPVAAPVAEPTGNPIAGPIGKPVAEPNVELIAEPATAPAIGRTRDSAAVANAHGGRVAEPAARPTVSPRRTLTQAESLYLGSINAAAWSTSPAMSELFELITTASDPGEPAARYRTWYRVVHSVGTTPLAAAEAAPRTLGWTTLEDLPAALGTALRAASVGSRVGPIRSGIGWHFATVTATQRRPDPQSAGQDIEPTRLAAFNRWLDQRRRALVTHAPGFEHPGDPSQPDNTHRH